MVRSAEGASRTTRDTPRRRGAAAWFETALRAPHQEADESVVRGQVSSEAFAASDVDGRKVRPPIADADLGRVFANLENAEAVVLAVSGGPDSMALMALAARWAVLNPSGTPKLHVATVDHALRDGSAAEGAMVARAARHLGLPHRTLVWSGPKPSTRLQERARAARYALLREHAADVGASHIVTAHHADDQAETVLLRLGRGSGMRGLAGMRPETRLGAGVTLVRPLLAYRKDDLVAVCRDMGVGWVDDPSNANPAFARTRLRAQAAALAEFGLDAPGLTRLAGRMARADAALEAEAGRVEAAVVVERSAGTVRLGLSGTAMEAEILLRVIRRAIAHVAAEPAVIRLDRLETLSGDIAGALAAGRPHRATLGGTRIGLTTDGIMTVVPEAPRSRGRPKTGAILP